MCRAATEPPTHHNKVLGDRVGDRGPEAKTMVHHREPSRTEVVFHMVRAPTRPATMAFWLSASARIRAFCVLIETTWRRDRRQSGGSVRAEIL